MADSPQRITAHDLIDNVLDPGSWVSWDGPAPTVAAAGTSYAADLAAAADRSGVDESILTGEGTVNGRRVAAVVGEFAFLAGSMGRTATERVVLAYERAQRERLPLFASPASGGTRMQEGTPAFVGMVKIAAACTDFKNAGLPYVTYLRHPTTGGVFASWGSLGHMTTAQPGATIGFLGARVFETLYGESFPTGVQTAENLYDNGIIDAILPLPELKGAVDRALDILGAPMGAPPPVPDEPQERLPETPAWESITRSRRDERPGVRMLLRFGASSVVRLHGTGQGERDPGMLMALARFGGATCVLIGHDRRHGILGAPLSPGGLRVARRGMRLSAELGLPLVTVIDTAGAALSREAEEGGLAGEIARSLAELTALPSPTVCVLLGQGTGGGALAVMPADRVICAEHSWLSPLPPEGASAILHRDTTHAAELATAQRVRSADLLADGIVDHVVPEHPDAADEPEAFCARMSLSIEHAVTTLVRSDPAERLRRRRERYRRLGVL